MPKMKTNRAAKKRYSYTATGKVKRTRANKRHLLAAKTKRTKSTANTTGYADKTCVSKIKNLLPYAD